MTPLKRHFDLTITLLSPLHIGTGRVLQHQYDYVIRAKKTWFLNTDVLLDRFADANGVLDTRVLTQPPSALMDASDFKEDNPIFRYVVDGTPRSVETGIELREQIKDVYGKPYIPGSSIKGALRTALVAQGFQSARASLDVAGMGHNAKYAAQTMERRIMGANPNRDLLRALHVADTQGVDPAHLKIYNARVVTGGDKPGSPIELEALATDAELRGTLTIDNYLHTPAAESVLGFGKRWQWLEDLPAILRARSVAQLTEELAWFKQRKYQRIEQLFAQMLAITQGGKLGANRAFVQIGWGGGWSSKTLGSVLRAEPRSFEALLTHNRLSPARLRYKKGGAFPASRRVIMVGDQPVAPLGWCMVEMKEKK